MRDFIGKVLDVFGDYIGGNYIDIELRPYPSGSPQYDAQTDAFAKYNDDQLDFAYAIYDFSDKVRYYNWPF